MEHLDAAVWNKMFRDSAQLLYLHNFLQVTPTKICFCIRQNNFLNSRLEESVDATELQATGTRSSLSRMKVVHKTEIPSALEKDDLIY
jgi:hypothetical protein